MKPNLKTFKKEAARAVANTYQRGNLDRAMHTIRERRDLRFAELTDGEGLQWLGNAIKQDCLKHLPELLEQLETKLTQRGVQVHWAETPDEANRIVLDIAKRHQVKQVVKGKSMVSEEMELNAFLGEHGIEALEADFGEFIVQLAGQTPSHIVVPAIHMDRKEIARLFEDTLGVEYTEDVDALTALARKVLRERFQSAGMGISGVNFAVAETGSLCLVENEGNGRMVTTVPPVHVALMGLEKVIARLDQLPPLLRLLTRSATGQAITTYFNWISSPRGEGERDGPLEVHLIVLDNGRSAIYGDAELRETLDCIRCGACINICPVYERIGGHAYGSSYMGPIGQVLTPQMAGVEAAGHLPGASTLCGACYEVCPVKIPLPNLLLRLRREASQPTAAGAPWLHHSGATESQEGAEDAGGKEDTERKPGGLGEAKDGGAGVGEKIVWKGWKVLHNRPAAYRMFRGLLGLSGGWTPPVGPARAWSKQRRMPKIARKSLHRLMEKRGKE